MGKRVLVLAAFGLTVAVSAVMAGDKESGIFTLYRSSVLDQKMRLHIATFDSADGADGAEYNSENCQQAQALFQGQPGVNTRFCCESGRFKK